MDPKIIVMIIMLSMPNGDSGVHVKPYATVETCVEAANIEATDPFVRNVECAQLDDGMLTLRFDRENAKQRSETPPDVAATPSG
ncbi:hypothetical protein ACO2I3_09560 [Leptospira interrogans]